MIVTPTEDKFLLVLSGIGVDMKIVIERGAEAIECRSVKILMPSQDLPDLYFEVTENEGNITLHLGGEIGAYLSIKPLFANEVEVSAVLREMSHEPE